MKSLEPLLAAALTGATTMPNPPATPSLFLNASIEMGKAIEWQTTLTETLQDLPVFTDTELLWYERFPRLFYSNEMFTRMNGLLRRREEEHLFDTDAREVRIVGSDKGVAVTQCPPTDEEPRRARFIFISSPEPDRRGLSISDDVWDALFRQEPWTYQAFLDREKTMDVWHEQTLHDQQGEGVLTPAADVDIFGRGKVRLKHWVERIVQMLVGSRDAGSRLQVVLTALLNDLFQPRVIAPVLALIVAPRFRSVAGIMLLAGAIPGIKADPGPLEISSGVVAGAINIWTANVVPTQDRTFTYFYHVMILIMIMLVLLYAYKSISRREGVKRRMAFVLLAIGGGVALAAWFSGQQFEKCLAFFLVLSGFFMSFMFDHGTAIWSDTRQTLYKCRDFAVDQAAILYVRLRVWIVRKLGPQPGLGGVDPPV